MMVSLSRPSSPESDLELETTSRSWQQPPPRRGPPLIRRLASPESPPASFDFFADADAFLDSEVMVRTAQASRLRRRGAIRIEAGVAGRTATATTLATRRDEGAETEDPPDTGENTNSMAISFMVRHNVQAQDFSSSGSRSLYCGGIPKRRRQAGPSEQPPLRPSPLPWFGPSSSSTTPLASYSESTGCGALIHSRASPSARLCVWLANTDASRSVAPLESGYVEKGPRDIIRLGASKCGCRHEGIGCRSCGNSLGMRVRHCARHLHNYDDPECSNAGYGSPPTTTTYIFNPYNVTHNSHHTIPFPHHLPFSLSPPPSPSPATVLRTAVPTIPSTSLLRPGTFVYPQRRQHYRPSIPDFSHRPVSPIPSSSSSSSSSDWVPSILPPSSQCPTPSTVTAEETLPADRLLFLPPDDTSSIPDSTMTSPSSSPRTDHAVPLPPSPPVDTPSTISVPLSLSNCEPNLDIFDGQVAPALLRLESLRDRLNRLLEA